MKKNSSTVLTGMFLVVLLLGSCATFTGTIPVDTGVGCHKERHKDCRFTGRVVWEGRTQPVEWNGTLRNREAAPDGVYRYTVSCTDEAGNTTK